LEKDFFKVQTQSIRDREMIKNLQELNITNSLVI